MKTMVRVRVSADLLEAIQGQPDYEEPGRGVSGGAGNWMKRLARKTLGLPEEEDYHKKKKRLYTEKLKAELERREKDENRN